MDTQDSKTSLENRAPIGIIEGFYGPPWSREERLELFDWMSAGGLNTYLYAPKDDLKQRVLWREPYSAAEAVELKDLISACQGLGISFVYAISPGLDIRYSSEADRQALEKRFEEMLGLGCEGFALLFDDIPERLDAADLERWGSLGAAQANTGNSMFTWLRKRKPAARFLLCPTAYCGRMADAGLGGVDYLESLGRELNPEIKIFWTGPEIISQEISVEHIAGVSRLLGRKPLIWDNLHANDYDGRRFFCGPYAGRSAELREGISGILLNPNTEFPLNYVPIQTFGRFWKRESYEARAAYLEAMRSWLPRFARASGASQIEDLILFGDCFYLPYEEGPEGRALLNQLRSNLSKETGNSATVLERAKRLRDFCGGLPELLDRALFHALSRRVWDLREELDLVVRYLEHQGDPAKRDQLFRSDYHLPHTYRGGFVATLQKLLAQQPDGTFVLSKEFPNE